MTPRPPAQPAGGAVARAPTLWQRTGAAIKGLPPAAFSFVMATGIVSLACDLTGLDRIARALFALNAVAIVALLCAYFIRLAISTADVRRDLQLHAISPGYFTVVAGFCVFALQLVQLGEQDWLASRIWLGAVVLWAGVTYSVFTLLIVHPRKPSLRTGLNGVWLIGSVATQSISVLGSAVAAQFPAHHEAVLFIATVFFFMGCMLYINVLALIFFRLTFVGLTPLEMTPPYWISMGATAIATQAGAALMLQDAPPVFLADLLPFIKGFTLFFWSAGTWWIPLLISLWLWSHLVRRAPLAYSTQVWGMVFPIGMYTACTHQLALAIAYDGLRILPQITVYLALLAWGLAAIGLLRALNARLRS